MAKTDGERAEQLVLRVRRRLRNVSLAANAAGAVFVFLFVGFVLPQPRDVHHSSRVLIFNAALLVIGVGGIGIPLAAKLLVKMWNERIGWVADGREPSDSERAMTLRFPLTQQAVVAVVWAVNAVLFAVVNLFFSGLLAISVAITVLLGGVVTVALGYLLSERHLRPIMALVLESGLPARPQLPGVAARALLSWTLGAGVVLLGLALVALGALVIGNFDVTQLSVVVLVLAVTGLLVGSAAIRGLARSLADRVEALRAAVADVEQGNFDHGVTVDDGSEIGLLQAGFNRMVSGLHERERIRDLFGRQVGEDVVQHALEHGVELGGEARDAAVLFIDLQGSTQLAQERDPSDVVSLLNDFFAIVVDVVAGHDGWVNKFEGDAALCAFGVPLADDDAASQALAAARELSRRLSDEMAEITAGIGVSAGRVVAGNVGAAKRFEYTVIGDPVNEAARLSELAKSDDNGVLASGAALAAAGEQERERWRRCDEKTLRGRSEATEISAPAT